MTMLLIVIGSFFSLAAALTAALITGYEYMQGQKPDRRLAFWMALRAGLTAFAIFAVITAGIGFALSKILNNP
jgi:hypothetical protein